ncbi:hypothetical protein BC936DRAFT_145957 [Jimgerdemannia flammicorona]|uniref:NmrA-like domain-containing protein n=1 Tax=Jimgerdemannia flammicorona TaxID=994334 RepID=A0A433D8T4_9FUNG|nr:hypothetical protein BC936DRAFT_145957 [Jimgerdemannia flammicorona]
MTTPSTSLDNKQITLVITSGDQYIGNEFAHHMLTEYRADFRRLSVTLVHPERGRCLRRSGAELKPIDYKNENSLVAAFGGEVDWVLLVPDSLDDNRVENTKKLVDAMQRAGQVANVIFISVAGAEAQNWNQMKELLELENYVKQKGKNWVILRTTWISNIFHLWGEYVVVNGKFPLTLEPNQKFSPIQHEDITRAVHAIIHGDTHRHHQGKTYTLTGPEQVGNILDGPEIVDRLNRAIGNGRVEYLTVKREVLENYLKSRRDGADDKLKDLFEGQPTDKQTQTLLDELEWVRAGQADFTTDDLKNLIGSDGQKLEEVSALFRTCICII